MSDALCLVVDGHLEIAAAGGRAFDVGTVFVDCRDAERRPYPCPGSTGAVRHTIVHVALIVRDYDEAIAYYTGTLGFTLVEDTHLPAQDKRWVVVAPAGAGDTATGTSLLLARAATPDQARFIGNQAGGRVFLFLRTDDFWRDYQRLTGAGVTFIRPPQEAPYGTVAVFEDLYGNRWDLVQFTPRP